MTDETIDVDALEVNEGVTDADKEMAARFFAAIAPDMPFVFERARTSNSALARLFRDHRLAAYRRTQQEEGDAEAMREAAAKIADNEITRIFNSSPSGHGYNAVKRIRDAIRALPLAHPSPDAATKNTHVADDKFALLREVVKDRIASDISKDAEIARLKDGLRELYRGYVNTLENGRDRIVMLGGDCDSVDRMEEGDHALFAARTLLSNGGGND